MHEWRLVGGLLKHDQASVTQQEKSSLSCYFTHHHFTIHYEHKIDT